MAKAKSQASGGKSGLKKFEAGKTLFSQNDPANSLYIIQTGQIRLFIPKGIGFVELAILRTGEVIGEMAYFDEKSTRRSCSAAAIVETQVIEISFAAFEKTMSGLNPWFKTIINTIADRLRKTNDKVKALESNSVGFGAGGKVSDYKFFHNIEIIKMLTLMYLAIKSQGKVVEGYTTINRKILTFYMSDIFNLKEIVYEEFFLLLKTVGHIKLDEDESGQLNIVKVRDIESFKTVMAFINTQRATEDAKQLKISSKCERFLKRILAQFATKGVTDDKAEADISVILDDFKERKVPITDGDLRDAVTANLCDDIMVGSGNKLSCSVNLAVLKKMFPCIEIMNAIKKVNETKAGNGGY